MATIRLGPFFGAYAATRPKLLPPNVGVVSTNHWTDRGDLRPWKIPLQNYVLGGSNRKTIYMLGRDKPSDSIYWFEWPQVVHAVGSFNADDSTKRTYYTGAGGTPTPKSTDNIIGIAGGPYPTSYRDLGIPKPATAPTITQTVAGTGTDETRYYAYTYLSDWDEEGPPAVSAAVTCKPGANFNITTLAAAPSGGGENRGINRIRLYRTVAGESGASFFFLSEFAIATSTTDNALTPGVDTLQSTDYQKPPTDLTCLTGLWNGMMAGITGKAVRYCEPYKPHAWPPAYETLCAETPIALGVFQKNLLILTTGRPRLVYGSAPEAMDDTPVEFIAACVSVQSVVSFGHGVCWATSDGLAYVGVDGRPRLLTDGVMLLDDWQAIEPATIVGSQFNGMYFGTYLIGGSTRGAFMLDPMHPDKGIFWLSTGYRGAYFDPLGEKMYVIDAGNVKEWNAGASNMTATHRSKVFHQPRALNFSVGEVIADTFPVTLTIMAGSRTPFVKTVNGPGSFVLPPGKEEDWQLEVSTANDVTGVVIAETIDELNQT